jgi:hypothetical protein
MIFGKKVHDSIRASLERAVSILIMPDMFDIKTYISSIYLFFLSKAMDSLYAAVILILCGEKILWSGLSVPKNHFCGMLIFRKTAIRG